MGLDAVSDEALRKAFLEGNQFLSIYASTPAEVRSFAKIDPFLGPFVNSTTSKDDRRLGLYFGLTLLKGVRHDGWEDALALEHKIKEAQAATEYTSQYLVPALVANIHNDPAKNAQYMESIIRRGFHLLVRPELRRHLELNDHIDIVEEGLMQCCEAAEKEIMYRKGMYATLAQEGLMHAKTFSSSIQKTYFNKLDN